MNDSIWQGVLEDFSDLPTGSDLIRVLLRLFLAALFGACIGWEREILGKSAGLRTHMLVTLGAALLIAVPQLAGYEAESISRVIQGIMAGIGFLGAGVIVKHTSEGQVRGLTTAASIWLTTVIGIAAGMGRLVAATLGTLLALIVLHLIPHGPVKRTEEGKEGESETKDKESEESD